MAPRSAFSLCLGALVSGCGIAPTSICEMPSNEQFWQGAEVSWTGQVVDIAAPPHGGVIAFVDEDCLEKIEVDPRVVSNLYSQRGDFDEHAAVANFTVRGRISFYEDGMVLTPVYLTRISAWRTDAAFDDWTEERAVQILEKFGSE